VNKKFSGSAKAQEDIHFLRL